MFIFEAPRCYNELARDGDDMSGQGWVPFDHWYI
ncbi:hypothetical protein FOCG_11648 [Fusarium oxysporum f. sp. radicis-lycopersici 26381]|uniref:Uncharacterized protein n=1 Tax=Fusarium oxysporum Fo47 TaxID=660027 RepID=W9KZB1_FUSOX|nr:hypothetical protein FOZG_02555 [Fusarium oxysporum Fo47]EXL47481.1 hypothetical protein FOCG_11648 [Fusarium oxysporum f. sp. radicis-lycopersici 26381]